MEDFIVIAVIVIIIGVAVTYIRKAKKSGVKCIGCPAGGNCSHNHKESSGCNCGCGNESESTCDCGCHADKK